MKKNHNCRVCGYYSDDLPWGEDGNSPSYEICICCGVEFGNEDYTIDSVRLYRKRWIENGSNWFFSKFKPVDWDMEKQFENIPEDYR